MKKILFPILNFVGSRYLSKDRIYKKEGLRVLVPSGVFHPGLFISTRIFQRWLKSKQELKGKKVLELGAGSGFISLFAAREGAIVTATDINPKAVEGIKFSAHRNQLELRVIESDLFDDIPDEDEFGVILINPPYYQGTPKNDKEKAFFCGEDFDYFRKLFKQLSQRIERTTDVWMILSEDCNLNMINKLAGKYDLKMNLIWPERKWLEWNYIYSIYPLM